MYDSTSESNNTECGNCAGERCQGEGNQCHIMRCLPRDGTALHCSARGLKSSTLYSGRRLLGRHGYQAPSHLKSIRYGREFQLSHLTLPLGLSSLTSDSMEPSGSKVDSVTSSGGRCRMPRCRARTLSAVFTVGKCPLSLFLCLLGDVGVVPGFSRC